MFTKCKLKSDSLSLFKLEIVFSSIIHFNHSFPFLHSFQFPSPLDPLPLHFPSEKSRPPRDNNQTRPDQTRPDQTKPNQARPDQTKPKQNKMQIDKVKALLLRLDKASQQEAKSPQSRQKSQRHTSFHCQESQANSHNIYAKNLAGPVLATSVSMSSCEPYLVDSVSYVLLLFSDSYHLFSLSSLGFSEFQGEGPNGDLHFRLSLSAYCLAVGLCICSHMPLEEAPLMITE